MLLLKLWRQGPVGDSGLGSASLALWPKLKEIVSQRQELACLAALLTETSQQFDLQLYTSTGKVFGKLAVKLSHRGEPKSHCAFA